VSNLSELLPAGGGQNNFTFTASGAISNGDPVVLNNNGTVSSVAESSVSQSIGSLTYLFSNASITGVYSGICYHPEQKKVIICSSDSAATNQGVVLTADVSGTSITPGNSFEFYGTNVLFPTPIYDPESGKVVIFFVETVNNHGYAIVATVNGSAISFGTAVQWTDLPVAEFSLTYDSVNKKIVCVWERSSNQGIDAKVFSVNGDTLVQGAQADVTSVISTEFISAAFDENAGKVVVVFRNDSNSNYGTAVVGTVSGHSISFGSLVVFISNRADYIGVGYDPSSKKMVVSYRHTGVSSGRASVGEVSGNSITFGSSVTYQNNDTSYQAQLGSNVHYHRALNKMILLYRDNTAGTQKAVTGTVSDLSITFDTPVTLTGQIGTYCDSVYDPDEGQVVVRSQTVSGSAERLRALVYQAAGSATNLTLSNFIGLAGQAISDTATGTVNVIGSLNEGQSGLSVASDYYAYRDGSLLSGNVPYSINAASFSEKLFDVSSQETAPRTVEFKTDGTKMYVVGSTSDTVFQYSLSTAWDVSTASYESKSFSVASEQTVPDGIRFKPDGTKFYIIGDNPDSVHQYSMSTAWDISTASYDSVTFSVSSQATQPHGIFFKPDGTKFYICDNSADSVFQYALSTAWDLSTASYESKSFSTSPQELSPSGLNFNPDGTKVWVIGFGSDLILQYSLSTAWDASTASYDSVSFSVATQTGAPYDFTFGDSGTKFYVVEVTNDSVYQYSTTSYTENKVGKAISATQINMKNRS